MGVEKILNGVFIFEPALCVFNVFQALDIKNILKEASHAAAEELLTEDWQTMDILRWYNM